MIYFVEDDNSIRELVIYTLSNAQMEAQGFGLPSAFWKAMESLPDLILLDIMLPGINGIEILRRVRRESNVPVIMLTARDAVMDKVSGLDMGADDYITKPFAIEELLARIRVTLRKHLPEKTKSESILYCHGITLDTEKFKVTYNGVAVELTAKEFALLETLMMNKNIVMSRNTLLENVWGYEYAGETNVVDVYIRYLRQKLDQRFNVKLITTVRGVGYVIKEE